LNEGEVLQMATGAMVMAANLAVPILLASLVVGLAVSLFQSVTQIQEVTLTFVPKVAALALILTLAGHWMLSTMIDYTTQLIGHAGALVGG
jgi:flagellar biosynthetic protein FliQ